MVLFFKKQASKGEERRITGHNQFFFSCVTNMMKELT